MWDWCMWAFFDGSLSTVNIHFMATIYFLCISASLWPFCLEIKVIFVFERLNQMMIHNTFCRMCHLRVKHLTQHIDFADVSILQYASLWSALMSQKMRPISRTPSNPFEHLVQKKTPLFCTISMGSLGQMWRACSCFVWQTKWKPCTFFRSHIFIYPNRYFVMIGSPDSKVHGANMGPTWVLSAPDGRHVGPMNVTIRVAVCCCIYSRILSFLSTNYIPLTHMQYMIYIWIFTLIGTDHFRLVLGFYFRSFEPNQKGNWTLSFLSVTHDDFST